METNVIEKKEDNEFEQVFTLLFLIFFAIYGMSSLIIDVVIEPMNNSKIKSLSIAEINYQDCVDKIGTNEGRQYCYDLYLK